MPDPASEPFWLSAFLDLPASTHAETVAFWAGVTGSTVSASRGDHGEFATLVPPEGDDYLRVQRVDAGAPRVHLDVHVGDPGAAAPRLVRLGATVVADHGYLVLASPHGMVFCLVNHPATTRPGPRVWPGGHTSLVDQICLDIPPSAYAEECAFWQVLTGSELRHRAPSEFSNLARPEGQPIRVLLQRLDDEQPAVTAHLDLATTDRAAEVVRHEALGARVTGGGRAWTVLRDPAGMAYCITDRDPVTGTLR